MTDLLSLPTELIVHTLASCPDIRTTTCLASANKELHAIWLRHAYQILENIVRPHLPAYEDTTEVAKLQNSLLDKEQSTDATQVSPLKETPAVRHFNLLLRNATLASNLIESMKVAIARLELDNYRHKLDYTHVYAMYYFYAKLVLAYRSRDQKLKRTLYVTLSAASKATLDAHTELGNFLEHQYRFEGHTLLHDVPIHFSDPRCSVKYMGDSTCEWSYAYMAVTAAVTDLFDNTQNSLEEVMFNRTYTIAPDANGWRHI
jgi:hypothetical protein